MPPADELSPDDRAQLELLIEIEPGFGAWLDQYGIPLKDRNRDWNQKHAALYFSEAVNTGTADTLGPFLVAVDAMARDLGGGKCLDDPAGSRFASWLYGRVAVGTGPNTFDPEKLPPTLKEAWYTHVRYQNDPDNFTYGYRAS